MDNIVTMGEQMLLILRSYYKQKCHEGDEESQILFVEKDTRRKVAGLGQAIIHAVHPTAIIGPLQIDSKSIISIIQRSLLIPFMKWDSVHHTLK